MTRITKRQKSPAPTAIRLLVALFALATAHLLTAGEVIDHVVAKVNGRPILQSDWDLAVRCEALLDGRPLRPLNEEEKRASLDRVVDQELIRQQARNSVPPAVSADELQVRLTEVRQQLGVGNEKAWNELLAGYGLNAGDVEHDLADQIAILRIVNERLRPNVQVDAASISAYYRDKLEPELKKLGKPVAPLAEVSPQIEELLAQQRVDEMLPTWLKNLRDGAEVKIDLPSSTVASSIAAGSQ